MRWYAQASNSVHKRKSLFSSLSFPLKLNDRYVCLNSRASFTLCARAKIAPQKPHKFNYCCSYCYTQSFFFFHHTNFFPLYFICAKQQSTVLFFFQMHVDNAKEQCVSINIVIYLLLNAFKWQNSRKTVLFFLLICKLKMQRVFLVSFFSFVLCDFGPVFHVQCTKLKIAFVKFLPNAPSTRHYQGVCVRTYDWTLMNEIKRSYIVHRENPCTE